MRHTGDQRVRVTPGDHHAGEEQRPFDHACRDSRLHVTRLGVGFGVGFQLVTGLGIDGRDAVKRYTGPLRRRLDLLDCPQQDRVGDALILDLPRRLHDPLVIAFRQHHGTRHAFGLLDKTINDTHRNLFL